MNSLKPVNLQQRYTVPWQGEPYRNPAIRHIHPFRGGQQFQLPGSFKFPVLFPGDLLGCAHLLPQGIGVAVVIVYPVVPDQGPAGRNA